MSILHFWYDYRINGNNDIILVSALSYQYCIKEGDSNN